VWKVGCKGEIAQEIDQHTLFVEQHEGIEEQVAIPVKDDIAEFDARRVGRNLIRVAQIASIRSFSGLMASRRY
jgi:hypothetical protein